MGNYYENRDLLRFYRSVGGWCVQDFPMRAHRRKRGDILMCLSSHPGKLRYGLMAPMTNRLGCTDRLGTIFMPLDVA